MAFDPPGIEEHQQASRSCAELYDVNIRDIWLIMGFRQQAATHSEDKKKNEKKTPQVSV